MLKDLLFLILKSGIIGTLILNILMYAVFKEPVIQHVRLEEYDSSDEAS